MASPSPPLPQNVDCCVGRRPLLRQGRRGRPSSLGRRHHVLWRAVVVRALPPRPLLEGLTSGLLLGGYEWPRLCRLSIFSSRRILMLQQHERRHNIANSGNVTACSTMWSMRSRRHNWRLGSTARGKVAQASGREGASK